MEILSNKRFLWMVILILLVLNIATLTTVWVNRWNDRIPRISESRLPVQRDHFLKHELNLTADQQVEFDKLMNKHREQLESKVNEIRTLREKLMSMIRNQEFSPDSEDIVRRIGEKQSELELLNYNHFKEVMAICDDEQKLIFLETLRRAVGPRHFQIRHDIGDNDRRSLRRNGRR